MTDRADELRARRDALRAELREVEQCLSAVAPQDAEGPSEAWRAEVARAREFLLFVDLDLRVRFISHIYPGAPDPLGQPVFEYIPAEAHAKVRDAARAALGTGLPQHYDVESVGPDGGRSYYSNWLVPLRGDAPAALAFIAVDVKYAHRVEEALEGERGLFESLVAHAPDHITVINRAHAVEFVNRVDHGWVAEEVLGQPTEAFVHEADRDRVHALLERVFETGASLSYRARVQSPNGERIYLTRAGPVIRGSVVERVSLVSTDITDQVHVEDERAAEQESLRQSEERFRVLVEYAPEAVVLLDPETGRFTDVNENACQLFGYSREELVGLGPIELSPERQPDGRPSAETARRYVERALDGDHVVFEWHHRTATGQIVPCEVRLVKLPYAERRLVRGSVLDISQRKHAEAERERLAAELFQAQKMQALGQLTGGVAHDFNNLLTVMMGNVELIQSGVDDPAQVRELSGQIMQATERAAGLTQRLLAFSRRQPLRPQRINVNRLIADIEHLLRRTLGETIEIETVQGAGLWSCDVDPGQLENAILNLAINARDAMTEGGGRLTIETANARLDREYALSHEEVDPGQYVMLAITDNGSGMSSQLVEQAFEPFFTTKPPGRGSGLGLSMVHGFVKQSGGHVKIYSELGVGTTIRIYLPRAQGGDVGQHESRSPADERMGDGSLVLVVEDADSVRQLVVRMLELIGYRTLDAPNAAKAMQLLAEHPVRLLLTDVVLPGPMNGADLARAARERRPDLRVLFMSGYTENAIIHNGRLDAGVTLIEKPFTRRELAVALREALDED